METKQVVPISAVVADHQITEALQKYARTARDLGHEEDVAWALQAIRRLDIDAAQKARQKEIVAEGEIRIALDRYIIMAETQGRENHVKRAKVTLRNLNRNNFHAIYDAIESLELKLNKLNDRVDAVAASIPRKK